MQDKPNFQMGKVLDLLNKYVEANPEIIDKTREYVLTSENGIKNAVSLVIDIIEKAILPEDAHKVIFKGIDKGTVQAKYECPVCHKEFGTWDLFNNIAKSDGMKNYCPHCNNILDMNYDI